MMFHSRKGRAGARLRAWGLLALAMWASLPAALAQTQPAARANVRYTVDFSYLQQAVPGSVAWLYQPDTTINQPVMFSQDAGYYLKRRFDGSASSNGAIFVTGAEPPDFSAPVVTLYGNNCMDNTLFGSLSEYRDDAYYQKNPTLFLLTPQGNYRLDIFAGVRVKLTDTETWKVSSKTPQALFASDLPAVLEKSFLTPLSALLPTEADAWAVLATESEEKQGSRFVLYARKRPLDDARARTVFVNQLEMDSRATLNGYHSVENVGSWMLYAQNDPLWNRLTFETETSGKRRPFGDGGCGPTAVAMAIVNLVGKEELIKLGEYAASPFGFRFCPCSVNEYWCSGKHLPYRLTTADAYLRYFPLAVAGFAAGNNIWGVQGRYANGFGTSMHYVEKLCQIFDISVSQTRGLSDALAFLQKENAIVIACTTGYGSPFTNTSHFLVLAGVDDTYLYVLDPLRRSHYQALDQRGYLEVLTPGLVRIKLEDAAKCSLYPAYLLERAAP